MAQDRYRNHLIAGGGGGLDGGADRLPVDTRTGDPAEQVKDAEADDGAAPSALLTVSREGARTDRQASG